MTLEEILENFKQQKAELSKTIKEGTEQLEILKERLIRVSGAVEGIQLAIENVDKTSPEEENVDKILPEFIEENVDKTSPEEENERGETEILSE
jgi:hypothetical protein